MESCLDTNEVLEACSKVRPTKPEPEKDMIREDFIAIDGKTEADWTRYRIINRRYKVWSEGNRRATNLIKRFVNDTIQSDLARYSTAKEIWDYLETTYRQNNVSPAYRLSNDLLDTSLSNSNSVTEYLEKIVRLARELDQLGFKIPDTLITVLMLRGLSDKYNSLVSELQNYSLEQWKSDLVKNRILTYHTPDAKPTASVPTTAPASANLARNQGRKRGRDKDNQGKPVCGHCGKPGHTEDECYLKHPEKQPEWFKRKMKKRKLKEQASSTTTVKPESASHTRISGKIIEWEDPNTRETDFYVDSAATKHFCRNAQAFETLKSHVIPIEVASGEKVKSVGMGPVDLPLQTSDEDVEILELSNVIYAPDLNANLLSVDQLNESGYGVTLLPEGSEIFDISTGRHVAKIVRVNSLYKVIVQDPGDPEKAQRHERAQKIESKTSKVLPLSTWHRRLGHLGNKNLTRLLKKAKIDVFDTSDEDYEDICGCCKRAKQTRQPYQRRARQSSRPFELVHTDICGPFPISIDSYKYFVTFTDDFTRFSNTFCLQTRDDVVKALRTYSRRMKRQFGWKLKKLRSDNAGEYASDVVDKIFSDEGIIWEPIVGYAHGENGVSERLNRTLCEKLRALLFESGLPTTLWSRLIETATYLKNRSPTKPLGGKTPYEALYKRIPDLSNLRIIGSKAWVAIPLEKLQKLDARSAECRLIGYAASTQYILWQEDVNQVIFSRDVVFDEGLGPQGEVVGESISSVEPGIEVEVGTERNKEIEKFRTNQELQFLAENPVPRPQDTMETSHSTSRSPSPPSTPILGDFDAPNPLEDEGEEEPDTETQIPLEPSFSRYGRKRIPSRRFREAEEARKTKAVEAWITLEGKGNEPTYAEAMSAPDRPKWEAAIKDEHDSLIENKAWVLVKESEVPPTHEVIDGRWVLRKKFNGRYKARWVIRGFRQEYGVDYFEVFAAVARISSYRMLFALAAILHLTVFQLDIKTAFLYGKLDEEIYMTCPIGFEVPGYVCRLLKSLYGLKQAPRVWAETLKESLVKMGFKRLESDHCIYVKMSPSPILIGVYVDDILLAAKSPEEADEVRRLLVNEYQMTDLEPARRILGIEVIQDQGTIFLHQKSYLEDLLRRTGMDRCKPKSTPLPPGIILDPEVAGPLLEDEDKVRYHSTVGSINHAVTHTRPDLAFAASILSRFVTKPQRAHEKALQHVLRYIRGYTEHGIRYVASPAHQFYGYTDSDHGGTIVKQERKSTSGYMFWLANGPISWSSKRQSTIATSTTEAEYIGQFNAGTEACWIRKFLTELGFEQKDPTVIRGDNQTAIDLSRDPIQHSKAKHLDIKYHWQRQRVEEGDIKFEYVPSDKNLADWLTKPLTSERFTTILDQVLTKSGKLQSST